MDLINIKARVPDSLASPILVAAKQSVIIGFHVVNITASSSVIDIILRRGVSDTYIIKEHTISGSDPYNPLTGRFILQLGDEVYIKSLGTDTADCFISYCEIDDIGGGGSSYDHRVPVIQSGEGNYIFRAKLDETGYELVPTTEVFPTFTAPADNDKYLSIVEGVISWVPKPNSLPDITAPADNGKFLSVVDGASTWVTAPNSLPDITIADEDRVLAVQSGEAAWIDAPSSLPDITVGDEGKALAVIDGVSKWCDPLAELGMGTGFFELDDGLNIVPKAKSQLYSEINLGAGHFEFTGEGDLRMKSGGDYRVGSTLPPHNASDNGKVLQVSAGEPAWNILPEGLTEDQVRNLIIVWA